MEEPSSSKSQIAQQFHCPGDPQEISRSVHLARLAAGFENCRDCIHNAETGSLPKSVVRKALTQTSIPQRSLIAADGIRGVYLNELTREKLARIVESVLDLNSATLLKDHPESRPRVLVGSDWRGSSPDLSIGVVNTLRRWGCDTADLGIVSQPCFEFALDQFRADFGLFVTGGVHPEKINGLSIYDGQSIPWCKPGRLAELEETMLRIPNRFARTTGRYQSVSIHEIYLAKISMLFPEECELKVGLSCGDPISNSILKSTLQETGCEVQQIANNFSESQLQPQLTQFRYAVRERHVDLGVFIRPDGQSIYLFDERGKEISSTQVVGLCCDNEIAKEMSLTATRKQPLEELLRHQQSEQIPIVADHAGRYWQLNQVPRCDAITVTAKVINKLQKSEWPLSALAGKTSSVTG